jgi:hypothetical protein
LPPLSLGFELYPISPNGQQILNNFSPSPPLLTNFSGQTPSQPSELLQTPLLSITFSTSNSHAMVTRTKDNTRNPRKFSNFVAHHSFTNTEPRTFNKANLSEPWQSVMSLELNALANNKTWTLVPPPVDQRVIWCK